MRFKRWGQDTSRRDLLKTAAWLTAVDVIGAAGGTFARAEETKPPASPSLAQIDTALRDATRARLVPGVVAMAANDSGIIYEGVFGSRHLGQEAAMRRDTVFRIASMIKLITSVAAMQLVEQGKLSLDEPVPAIDPAIGAPQVLTGFDAAGAPLLRPPQQAITLRHLLTHTAGFAYRLWDTQAMRYQHAVGALPARKRAALPRTPLMFDPGTRWQYGTSIDWVGRLVEATSGERLDLYFRKHILDPLGMADTGFGVSISQHARQASVHGRKADGTLVPEALEKPFTATAFSAAAHLFAADLDGTRILRPDGPKSDRRHRSRLKTNNPGLSNDVDFFPGIPLRVSPHDQHGAGGERPQRRELTWAGLDPTRRIAAVFMTQVLPASLRFLYRRRARHLRCGEGGVIVVEGSPLTSASSPGGRPAALQAIEIEIDHRRRVEREQLAERQAAHHGVAERLAQFRAGAGAEHQRHAAEQRRRRGHQDRPEPQQAGFADRIDRRHVASRSP
jgi:methyl acetate hydrolase